MQGADKFDFYLSMKNVSVNDSGSYVAKLEVIHPETGSYSSIQKTFTLTVNGKVMCLKIIMYAVCIQCHVMQWS